MRKTDLARYEKLLRAKRKELIDNIDEVKEDAAQTMREATGELSSHTYHMADLGTDAQEREKKYMLASKSGRLLYHIDEALRRIQDGTFGKCHICGGNISAPRLSAVPHARLCIQCKEAEEKKKARNR